MKQFNSVEQFYVKSLELSGFAAAVAALKLPYGKKSNSEIASRCMAHASGFDGGKPIGYLECHSEIALSEDDVKLITALIKKGDDHAKVLRGINAYCLINAPRYFHQELDTYRVGAERLSSESTMHIQGRGLSTEELIELKENLPEGTMQKRVWMFSYQTLRRIYRQRKNHRLPQWHMFCDWIESLPLSEELSLIHI